MQVVTQQDEPSQLVTQRRATGFMRRERGPAMLLQALDEPPLLERFARALGAFKSNEQRT